MEQIASHENASAGQELHLDSRKSTIALSAETARSQAESTQLCSASGLPLMSATTNSAPNRGEPRPAAKKRQFRRRVLLPRNPSRPCSTSKENHHPPRIRSKQVFSQPTRNGGNILETAAMAMIGLASAAAIAIELLRRSNLVAGLPGLDQLLPLLLR